jgi:hypothetical protein
MKRKTFENRILSEKIEVVPAGSGPRPAVPSEAAAGTEKAPAKIPEKYSSYFTHDDKGELIIKNDGFSASDTFGMLQEVQNRIEAGNAALLENADNEARTAIIQRQVLSLQKVFGLIQQNMGNALAFIFKVINFFTRDVFGLGVIQ